MTLIQSPNHTPRESFSISQVEKAFGSGYGQLIMGADGLIHDPGPFDPSGDLLTDTGCLAAWGYRYLSGIKQPEYTWEQAQGLPEGTDAERRLKGSIKAKTWGKFAEGHIERHLKGTAATDGKGPIPPHIVIGLHLLPHPSDVLAIELQGPIKVRTSPEAIGWGKTAIPNTPGTPGLTESGIAWVGFKDFVPTLATNGDLRDYRGGPGVRYLIDFKTTKPKVDNIKNETDGKPPGSWAYQKTPEQLRLDWQFNLYLWDEYIHHGYLPGARWAYWASPGTERYPNKPEARASDVPDPNLEQVRSVVRALDSRGRFLRDLIRAHRVDPNVETLPKNLKACGAYGGCEYSAALGGPCTASPGFSGIIPIDQLTRSVISPTTKKSSRPKPDPIGPGFTFTPTNGDPSMNILEQINAAQAAAQAQPPAPIGAPPWAPPATATPGPAPWAPPSAGQPAMGPGFAFGAPPAAAPAPPPPPVAPPAPARPQAPVGFGAQQGNPDYWASGTGGWLDRVNFEQACQYYGLEPGQFPSYLTPLTPTATAVPPSPTPGLPPEAFAPGGPMGPTVPTTAPTGAPAPGVETPGPVAPRRGPGRPSKQPPAAPTLGEPSALDRIAAALESIARHLLGN